MNTLSELVCELRILPCFSGLDDDDLLGLGQRAKQRRILKNTIIFDEADPMEFFFIVKEGAIKLFKTSPEGRELIVKIIGRGDYSCCAPLYADGKYSVSAMALNDSTLIVISAEDFKEMLNSKIGTMGLKIIVGLCTRVKYLANLVEDLTFKDVEQRVIMALLRLTEEKFSDNPTDFLSVTHQDIASMTGTVREVVSRIMSKLKKEGIILQTSVRGFKIDKVLLLKLL